MIAPARRAAYQALRAISAERIDLPAALARERDPLHDRRDRALAGEIVLGVLRWRAALDVMIERLARRPLARLDPEVVDILRLALYQLWQLQRVPPSAVVNDAVELTRVARKGRASALVNATLRAFARTAPEHLLPPREESASYLSVGLSHPQWLVERWLTRFGFDATEQWLIFNNSPAPLTLRVNTARTSAAALAAALAREQVETAAASYAPDALVVTSGNPLRSNCFAAGEFIVQDEASQLVAHMSGVTTGERVLDACASPGGKTVIVSNTMQSGFLVAADVRARRTGLLADTLRRTGTCASIVQLDLRDPLPFRGGFDCVIVDAPCSGLGTLRRDPDIKWRRTEAEFPTLAMMQMALLEHAADGVRRGGRVVYSTCSSEPEENDELVDRFLSQRQGIFVEAGPAWARARGTAPRLSEVCDARGRLRTLPHRHGLEAFFAAVLVRVGGV
jgi:16S rRNA (cytosine967-C5)-methyltransferase